MITTLLLLQTILLPALPSTANYFNNSLSSTTAAFSLVWSEENLPEEEVPGKIIKESQKHNGNYRIKTVVIDPGHGGHDPGCLGSSSQEKHIALAIARRLALRMKEQFPEIKIILTRDEDVFVPLHERAHIANRNQADLFISIHCNFMPRSEATSGTETYVMGLHTAEHNLEVAKRENSVILLEENYEKNYDFDPNSPEGHIMLSMFQNAYLEQSILFAERVEEKAHSRAQRRSRGVKQAGFVVLKETAMPSVLIEAGFLSNLREERFLKDEQGQHLMAEVILEAFNEYKATLEGTEPAFIAASSAPAATNLPQDPFQPTVVQQSAPEQARAVATSNPEKKKETPSTTYTGNSGFGTPVPGSPPASAQPTVQPSPARASAPRNNPPAATNFQPSLFFCVQLAASAKPVDTSDSRWSDIRYPIEVVEENNYFKYQARNFSSLPEALEARNYLRSKGFNDAFIVAYKNGERISMDEARRLLGQ